MHLKFTVVVIASTWYRGHEGVIEECVGRGVATKTINTQNR